MRSISCFCVVPPLAPAMFQIKFFRQTERLIKAHGKNTENYDRRKDKIKLEDLASVYDKISQSPAAADKFADDNAHETQTDVDLHGVQKDRHRAGQNHFGKDVTLLSAQCVDKLYLFRIDAAKASVDGRKISEYSDGNTSRNDRFLVCAQPDDEKRGEGRFRKTV